MNYLEQEKNNSLPFLYVGENIRFVPEEIRRSCALRVGQELSKHPHTMLQFTPTRIFASMNEGYAVLTLEETKFVGFAQLWQYGFNEDGQQILEFGSWISFISGYGEKILIEAVKLGKKIRPKAQIVAIVEEDNTRALEILNKVGAKEIGNKFSPVIRTVEGEAAFMKIFDITELPEKEAKIMQKKRAFYEIGKQISPYETNGRKIPDRLFQSHLMLDRWLTANCPEWNSRYGFPPMMSRLRYIPYS